MANNNNFSLVDFFNAFRNRHTYDKYTQDGSYKTTDRSQWANADVNNDGKLDIKDGAAIERQYNTIGKSKTVYDITNDGEVKFDDLLGFSEEMDINGDGTVCGGEKAFLKGRTKLVFAQVKENLQNDKNFKLNDLMDYSKAVSNLDDGKKQVLNNEIASLEETMINKLKNLKNGNLNDLKSFWGNTAGADKLNLGHASKLMDFLDETETGLKSNVKKADSSMTDDKLETLKREIQGNDYTSYKQRQTQGQGGCGDPTPVATDDCGCGGSKQESWKNGRSRFFGFMLAVYNATKE